VNILINDTPVKVVYKRFSPQEGSLCSLATKGPIEKTYRLGLWTHAEGCLLAH